VSACDVGDQVPQRLRQFAGGGLGERVEEAVGGVPGIERPPDTGRAEPPRAGDTAAFGVGGEVEQRGQVGVRAAGDHGGQVGLDADGALGGAEVAEHSGHVIGTIEECPADIGDRAGRR